MKRFLSLILAFVFVISVCVSAPITITASAISVDNLTFELNEDGESYSIIDCDEAVSGELIIPSIYNGLPVTSIGRGAFGECVSLENITIPDSVLSLGDWAFSNCSSLISINIPDSLMIVGKSAFKFCSALTRVEITSLTTWCDLEFPDIYANPLAYARNLYLNGELVSDLVIPKGITSINNYAFYNCISITNVTIPISVKIIGINAFGYCGALTNIEIPDSVTSIGYGAFQNCPALINAEIGSSVTNIGDRAFDYCTTLVTVTMSNSVTSMGEYVFNNCRNLRYIKLSDNIDSIKTAAFLGCESLESIRIPSKITSIQDRAFWYCYSLEKIYIPANVSAFAIDEDCFLGCAKEEIYFEGSPQQWADLGFDPSSKYLHFYATVAQADTVEINKMKFRVADSNDEAVISVTASYNDQKKNLEDENIIYLDFYDISTDILFSKVSYKNYIIPKTVLTDFVDKSNYFHSVYMDYLIDEEKPYISTVFAKEYNSEQPYQEVTTSEIIVLENKKYDIIISSENMGKEVESYYISQGEKYITSTTGVFNAVDLYNSFANGLPVFAYVKYKGGLTTDAVEVKLTKTVYPKIVNALLADPTLKLFDGGVGLEFPEDSIFAGMSLSTELCKFPLGVNITGNKIRVSVGVDIFSSEETAGNIDEQWFNYKEQISSLSKQMAEGDDKAKKLKKVLGNYKNDNLQLEDESKLNLDLSLAGYFEGYIYKDGIIFTEVCGNLATEVFFNYVKQLLVSGIPVYLAVKAGGEVSATATYTKPIPAKELLPEFDFVVKLEPSLRVSGGVGIKNLMSLGVYGKGTLPTTIDFPNNVQLTLGVAGSMGVEAEVLIVDFEWELFDGETTILQHNFKGLCQNSNCFCKKTANKTLSNSISNFMLTQERYNSSSDGVTYKLASREYLEDTSNWLGDMISPKQYLSSLFGVSKESTIVKELQTSVYKNSQLQLVEFNDTLMMAWIEDCKERDAYNRYKLVYSVYNKILDTWSEPKAVADSETNDFLPSLASDGENVYIAWQNIDHKFTSVDESTIQTILTNSEIKVAKYNSETDDFKNVKTLTDNASYDYAPVVTVNNGVAEVYWVNSSTTDYAAGSFSVLKNNFNDTTNTVVAEKLNYISEIDTSSSEVSYCMDVDGDLSTNDFEVFTNTTRVSVRDDVTSSSCLQVAYGTFKGNNTLFYADAYNIHYAENGVIKDVFKTNRAINGNLIVTENSGVTTLLWVEQSEIGTELFSCSYEAGAWSEPIQLTEYNAKISNIDAVYFNNLLYGAFNRTNLKETVTDGESTYTDESTDICVLQADKFTDLEISEILVNESTFVPGEKAKISVFVENKGTELINNVEFVVSDSKGNKTTITKDINLASGELELIDVEYTVPENFSATTLTVTANVENDIDSKNNSSEVAVGNTDISINDIKYEKLEDDYVVTAILKNNNLINAQDVVFNAYLDDTTESYGTVEIGTVNAGELKELRFKFNKNAFDFTDGYEQVKFTVTTSTNEQLTENNAAIVVISKPEHLETEWVVVKEATCTADGMREKQCIECKAVFETETIPAKGHTEVIVTGKAATCTATGLTDGKKCSVCGTPTVAQQTIKATGHKEEVIPAVAPTYTTVGKTEGKKCSVCGKETVAQKDVAKLVLGVPVVTQKNTSKGISLSWSAIKDAESYIIYRRTYNTSTKKYSGWTVLNKSYTGTSYTDTTVKLGTTYSYTVRAANKDATSSYKATTTLTYNVTPTVKVALAAKGIKVSWSTAANATGYTVYSSTYNTKTKKWSGWTNRGTVKANVTSWTDTKVKSGTKYRYTIKAMNNKVASAYNKSGVATLFLSQPTVKIANNVSGVKVSWNKITGAQGYTIYRAEYKNGKWSSWKNMGTIKKNATVSWVDKSAKSGTTYRYTVRAVNGSVKSSYVASNTLLYLAQPKTTVKAVSNGINVAWTQSAGATGYTVYRMEYNAKTKKWSGWKNMGTAKATKKSWTDKSAKKGVTYKYTVKAVNGKTASSYKSSSSVKR